MLFNIRGIYVSSRSFHYTDFGHKGAKYRIGAIRPQPVMDEIVSLRSRLEAYIDLFPDFMDSLVPVEPAPGAPEIALRMHRAAALTGVGPLAAVAGAIAEFAARAAVAAGEDEVIVENGGDVFIVSNRVRVVSLFAGVTALSQRLAFQLPPERCPVAVCSSSATMGHSMSFGKADLVTVVAADGALADAAATALCNRVQQSAHIDPALETGIEIPGVEGVLIVLGDRVGLIGDLPELVRNQDPQAPSKITRK
jgi:ApbE superfamily uncharacterized protein (UPF0280 family)